tara:strand:+ start:1733 stop:2608 length:876 start_codon:yes stop_codon:yes gene_type:complete
MKPKVSLLQFFTIGVPAIIFFVLAILVALVSFSNPIDSSSSPKVSINYEIRCVAKFDGFDSYRHDYIFKTVRENKDSKKLVSVKYFEINERDNFEEVFASEVPYAETKENLIFAYAHEIYKDNNLVRSDSFLNKINKNTLKRFMTVKTHSSDFSEDTNCSGFEQGLIPVIASRKNNSEQNQKDSLSESQLLAIKEEIKREIKAEMNEKERKELELQKKLFEYQLESWEKYGYQPNLDGYSSSDNYLDTMRKAQQDKINKENERRLYCLENYEKGVYRGTFGGDPRCPGRLR